MTGDSETLWEIIKYGWSLILPWNWYLHKRMDKISENHVTREEYNGTIDSLRKSSKDSEDSINRQIRECSAQISSRIDVLYKALLDKDK
jgi:hypothetical protein